MRGDCGNGGRRGTGPRRTGERPRNVRAVPQVVKRRSRSVRGRRARGAPLARPPPRDDAGRPADPVPDPATMLLHRMAAEAARRFPDAPAVLADETLTHAELDARTRALAAALRARGVDGGRVGLLLPNLPDFPAVFHGVLRAGASAVLLNPLYSPREVGEYAADSGARAIVTVAPLAERVPEGTPLWTLEELAAEAVRLGPGAAPDEGEDDDPTREAAVIYTSAMGGWARGARLTHGNLAASARSTLEAMGVGPGDRVLTLLPLVHAFGLTVTMNAPLSAGGAIVPVERFHPVRVLETMEETEATVVAGVPAVYAAMAAAAERSGAPRHALRLAVCGGAPLRREIAERWEAAFGIPLREGYGLTEASPVCLFNRVDRPNRAGTMGYAFPHVDVTIRDPEGRVVPRGTDGEICVRGANVFAGYVGDEGRDPAQFHGDALRTGDLGRMEADGAVVFRGFLKRMFTRSGFNVYPAEIERVLGERPEIAEARVAAVPDPDKENEIALTVRPAPGASLTEEGVREICREVLAAYKQPGVVEVVG